MEMEELKTFCVRSERLSDRLKEIRDLINDVHGDLLPYFYWKLI